MLPVLGRLPFPLGFLREPRPKEEPPLFLAANQPLRQPRQPRSSSPRVWPDISDHTRDLTSDIKIKRSRDLSRDLTKDLIKDLITIHLKIQRSHKRSHKISGFSPQETLSGLATGARLGHRLYPQRPADVVLHWAEHPSGAHPSSRHIQ